MIIKTEKKNYLFYTKEYKIKAEFLKTNHKEPRLRGISFKMYKTMNILGLFKVNLIPKGPNEHVISLPVQKFDEVDILNFEGMLKVKNKLSRLVHIFNPYCYCPEDSLEVDYKRIQ